MIPKHAQHPSSKQRAILAAATLLSAIIVLLWSAVPARFAWARGYHGAAYYLNYRDPALALAEGHYYFDGGSAYDLSKAANAFRLALRLDPKAPFAHYELGRIYFVEGDLARARRELDAELAANPGDFRAWYESGLVEMTAGNLASAEADFRAFIARAPTEWGGYNDLAFVLAKEGRYAESAAIVSAGMANAPGGEDIPWLWNSRGVAELNELHYEEARMSFERALALAEGLTPRAWQRAYSANDPAAAAASITNFEDAIRTNLSLATQGTTP